MIMKKFVLTGLVVFSFITAFSQFNKGRILLGGNSSFSATTEKYKSGNTTTTESKSTSFTFNPQVGYFFIDNFAAGLGLIVDAGSTKYEGTNNKSSFSSFQVAPFVRYYLKPGIFFQGMYGIGSENDTNTNGTKSSYSLSSWSLGAGYAWFLNDHVAVEPFIGYKSNAYKLNGNKTIDGGLSINIGLQVYLGASSK